MQGNRKTNFVIINLDKQTAISGNTNQELILDARL